MKKLNLIFVAVLLCVLTLSSCLSNDETPLKYSGLATVEIDITGHTSFILDSGETLIPTRESMTGNDGLPLKEIDFKRGYLVYSLVDPDQVGNQESVDPSQRKYDIDLVGLVSVDKPVRLLTRPLAETKADDDSDKDITAGDLDTLATAPIEGIDFLYTTKQFLTATVNYRFSGLEAHSFALVKYIDDNARPADGANKFDTIDVYLSHYVSHKTYGSNLSRNIASTYPNMYFMSFDLKDVIRNTQGVDLAKDSVTLNFITPVLDSGDNNNTKSHTVNCSTKF